VEISAFASRFLGKHISEDKTTNPEYPPSFADFHGPKPEMKRLKSIEEVILYVTNLISSIADKGIFPLSEIAIIYAKKSFKSEEIHLLPQMFGKALSSLGVMYFWVSEDYRSKRAYDITTDSVTISTIHSTKGLDYSIGFLIGLDFLEPGRWTMDQITSLTYVAITRVKYRLFIPYIKENDLINRLLGCLEMKS